LKVLLNLQEILDKQILDPTCQSLSCFTLGDHMGI
jgi:hypothetical protein